VTPPVTEIHDQRGEAANVAAQRWASGGSNPEPAD